MNRKTSFKVEYGINIYLDTSDIWTMNGKTSFRIEDGINIYLETSDIWTMNRKTSFRVEDGITTETFISILYSGIPGYIGY